ncbi:hypothetical protein ACWGGS_04465 [Streptomyces decoyicus]
MPERLVLGDVDQEDRLGAKAARPAADWDRLRTGLHALELTAAQL